MNDADKAIAASIDGRLLDLLNQVEMINKAKQKVSASLAKLDTLSKAIKAPMQQLEEAKSHTEQNMRIRVARSLPWALDIAACQPCAIYRA